MQDCLGRRAWRREKPRVEKGIRKPSGCDVKATTPRFSSANREIAISQISRLLTSRERARRDNGIKLRKTPRLDNGIIPLLQRRLLETIRCARRIVLQEQRVVGRNSWPPGYDCREENSLQVGVEEISRGLNTKIPSLFRDATRYHYLDWLNSAPSEARSANEIREINSALYRPEVDIPEQSIASCPRAQDCFGICQEGTRQNTARTNTRSPRANYSILRGR
ncbi:hypothetical protein HN011_004569 [Eciton burchellii]|nr:hypothetical protein HN011_004569 [Eciton burchellii]